MAKYLSRYALFSFKHFLSTSLNIFRHNSSSCQVRRTVNIRTYCFFLIFSTVFFEQNSSEPARILDFLAPDSICKYQNRQTNVLNCVDLTRVKVSNHNVQTHQLYHNIQNVGQSLNIILRHSPTLLLPSIHRL